MTSYYIRPAQVAIIRYLKEYGPITIIQLAKQTGLTVGSTQTTIHTFIKEYPHKLTKHKIKNSRDRCRVAYGWQDETGASHK